MILELKQKLSHIFVHMQPLPVQIFYGFILKPKIYRNSILTASMLDFINMFACEALLKELK